MTLRCFSYGGGVQSTAALVLAAQGTIDFPVFLFANVGDDSEHPDTLRYVREIALPYARSNNIALIELRYTRQSGSQKTLYRKLTETQSIGIPVYLAPTGKPAKRSCTAEFKIRRIAAWQRWFGATKHNPAVTGLGISIDEYQRMRTDSGVATQVLAYPLIDLRLSRRDCTEIIERAGLPVPPKSACWFCPYHRLADWQRLKRETPDLFDKAVALEHTLSERNQQHPAHGGVFLSRNLQPLDQVVGDQADMFDEDGCEGGFCMV